MHGWTQEKVGKWLWQFGCWLYNVPNMDVTTSTNQADQQYKLYEHMTLGLYPTAPEYNLSEWSACSALGRCRQKVVAPIIGVFFSSSHPVTFLLEGVVLGSEILPGLLTHNKIKFQVGEKLGDPFPPWVN